MAANTKIEWANHTFNPWRGCEHATLPDGSAHPGCLNCYAEAMSKRNPSTLGTWGDAHVGRRVVASEAYWKLPLKWHRDAATPFRAWKIMLDQGHTYESLVEQGFCPPERPRVFCASLADVFEDWQGSVHRSDGSLAVHVDYQYGPVPARLDDLRRRLFALIDATPNLDWLLLTKRPENIRRMWPACCGARDDIGGDGQTWSYYRSNVWLLTSVSDQETANAMIPPLMRCHDLVPALGVSAEPLVGPIDLTELTSGPDDGSGWTYRHVDSLTNDTWCDCRDHIDSKSTGALKWVIVGGESGHGARPCRPEWIRSLVQQCRAASVPAFVKQLGGNVVTRNDMVDDQFNSLDNGWPDPHVEHHINGFREDHQGADCRIKLRDKKGSDPAEWPEDLRVRQFPEAT